MLPQPLGKVVQQHDPSMARQPLRAKAEVELAHFSHYLVPVHLILKLAPKMYMLSSLQCHLIAESLDAVNRPPQGRLAITLVKVIAAQFPIRPARVQDMINDRQQGVSDGEDRPFAPTPPSQAMVLSREVGATRACGRPRRLHQALTQPRVALARAPTLTLAGTLLGARAQPCPRRQVRGRGEVAHVGADLGQDFFGRSPSDPGNGVQTLAGLLTGAHPEGELRAEVSDLMVAEVQVAQQAREQEPLMRSHQPLPRLLQRRSLG